ncbi:MAG: GDSL-type esterase/lipase family protein [Specibacter sp.]
MAGVLLLCAIFVLAAAGDVRMIGKSGPGGSAASVDTFDDAAAGSGAAGAELPVSPDSRAEVADSAALAAWGLDEGAVLALAGDSIASGEGGRNYLAGTDRPEDRCHRSANGLGLSLFGRANVVNVACSRSMIADFRDAPAETSWTRNPPDAQLAQLRAADPDVALVIVGANDIGFPHLLDRCVLDQPDCSLDEALAAGTEDRIASVGAALEGLYRDVRGAVDGQIWIPAYPNLLTGTGDCGRITESERIFGGSVVAALNDQIQQAVERVNDELAEQDRLTFIAGTATGLDGHGVCSPDPWVHSVGTTGLLEAAGNQSRAQELLHPTAVGYSSLTRAMAEHRAGQ